MKLFLCSHFSSVGMLMKEEFVGKTVAFIPTAPTISYIESMDAIPDEYSQADYSGLNLIDFYIVPHYLTAPFKKCTEKIVKEFSKIDIYPINNAQAIFIENGNKTELCANKQ